jgi:hypothetical protein
MARSIGRALGIGLSANTEKFSKGLKGARNDLDNFKSGVKRMGQAAAASFAVAGAAAIAFGKQSVNAYNEDLKSQTKLHTALKNTKNATDAQVASLEKLISKQQRKYGVSDDKLRAGYQKLIGATKSITKSHRLMSIAMDISAGTGKSLESVTQALAKGYLGNTGALGRLGTGLDKATIKTGNMEKIVSKLAEIHKGQASNASKTYEGKLAILNTRLDEFKENVGGKLIGPLSKLVAYIEGTVAPKIEAFFNGFTDGKKPLDDATTSAFEFGKKLKNIITWIKDNSGLVKGFAQLVAGIFVGIKTAAAIAALGKLVGAFRAVTTAAALTAGAEAAATGGASLAIAGPAIAAIAAAFTIAGLNGLLDVAPGKETVGNTSDYQKATTAANKKAAAQRSAKKASRTTYMYLGERYEWDKDTQQWYVLSAGSTGTYKDFSNPHPPGAPTPRASGGPVRRGASYLVGERGPEMFVPNGQSGRIVPSGQVGGGTNITFNLNGIVDADSARRAIEDVLRNSAKRLGPINLTGSAL